MTELELQTRINYIGMTMLNEKLMCAKSVFCFGGQKLETLFLANL